MFKARKTGKLAEMREVPQLRAAGPLFLSLAVHGVVFAGFAWLLHRDDVQYAQLVPMGGVTLQEVMAPRERSHGAASRASSRRSASVGPASASSGSGLPAVADELQVTDMPRLLTEVRIPYPEEARARGIQGAVKVDLLIDENGVVRDSKIIEGPGFGLNEAALQAVLSFKFEPARIQEKAVAVRVRYSYRFVLDH